MKITVSHFDAKREERTRKKIATQYSKWLQRTLTRNRLGQKEKKFQKLVVKHTRLRLENRLNAHMHTHIAVRHTSIVTFTDTRKLINMRLSIQLGLPLRKSKEISK